MSDTVVERFHAKVSDTIRRRALVEASDCVVVAVSGGPDSLALLYALHALRETLGITLAVAHLDHGLRRAAREDAHFVADAAAHLGLPYVSERVDVRGAHRKSRLSLEHVARRERYAFFRRVATALGARRVATGHTADDCVETVLLNLIRGTGVDGLAGIPPLRPLNGSSPETMVVRPLLDTWRWEIAAYCEALGIKPREDLSNRSRAFLRNRVRHELLPFLCRHFGAGVKEALRRLAEIARTEAECLSGQAMAAEEALKKEIEGGVALPVLGLNSLPLALRRRVVHSVLCKVSGAVPDIGFGEVERVLGLLARVEPPFELPGGVRARRIPEEELICLQRVPRAPSPTSWERALPVPGRAVLPDGSEVWVDCRAVPEDFSVPRVRRAREVFLDAGEVQPPLWVRGWCRGDRLQPLGMRGTKSVQDLFTEAKVPAPDRWRIPLLVDGGGILWVGGVQIADRVKITSHTQRFLHVRWVERGSGGIGT